MMQDVWQDEILTLPGLEGRQLEGPERAPAYTPDSRGPARRRRGSWRCALNYPSGLAKSCPKPTFPVPVAKSAPDSGLNASAYSRGSANYRNCLQAKPRRLQLEPCSMHSPPRARSCGTAAPEHNSGYGSLGPARKQLSAFRDLRTKSLLTLSMHCMLEHVVKLLTHD